MGKPNLTRIEITNFIERYMMQALEMPTVARVNHEFPDLKVEVVEMMVNNLISGGSLAPAIAEMRVRQKEKMRASNTNRPDYHTANLVRSGVREVSRKVLETKAYSVDVLKAKFEDGMEVKFAFTVDHSRGYSEYRKVKEQAATKPTFSEYGESLVAGMFRSWK